MAVQPFLYLALTDGTTTCTLSDGANGLTNYPPQSGGWAPNVAALNQSLVGGRGLYTDVVEEITINVRDTTAALCYGRLDTLARLLDQADHWWLRTETVSPVLLKYAPQGSTIASTAAPLAALVLGRVTGDTTGATQLPPTFDSAGNQFVTYGVTIKILRRGLWIGASESASAGAAANPSVLTITMPSTANLASPIELDFTGFTSSAGTGTVDIPSGFVFIGANNSFSLQQAESGGTGGLAAGATYVSTADAAARASGGNVGRLDHHLSAVGAESVINWTLPAAFLNSTRIGIYVTYRNNSAVTWTLRGEAYLTATALTTLNTTPLTNIAAGPNNPTAIYLGAVANRRGFDTLRLRAAAVGGSGGATIDFDTILAIDLSSGQTYVVTQQGMPSTAIGASFASKNVQIAINNSPNTLRDPETRLDVLTTAAVLPITPLGDTALNGKGLTLQAVWYATHLYNGATPYWTTQNNAGAAILNIGATITRQLAYLSPQ